VEFHEASAHRFELRFQAERHPPTLVVSLRVELPWIGWRAVPGRRERRPPGPFAAACARALAGGVLERVEKLGADRVIALRFADGACLLAELLPHGPNLVLVERSGRTVATARHPRTSRGRVGVGDPYRPPPLPGGKLVPFGLEPATIDALVKAAVGEGDDLLHALRRRVFGIGASAARLVISESLRTGRSPGEVLAANLLALERGDTDPVLLADPGDPLSAAEEGELDPSRLELLPWSPEDAEPGRRLLQRDDAAGTAGLYHEAVERDAWIRARGDGLLAIVRAEMGRLVVAERKVAEGLAGLGDPEKHRVWGEALLSGLTAARRHGDTAVVPDPYDLEGRDLVVPVPSRLGLAEAAADHFRRCRRARRGIHAADGRLAAIRSRREALSDLLSRFPNLRGNDAAHRLAEEMRRLGIPVDLESSARSDRSAAGGMRPRLEGVRMFTSSEGFSILVGRTGKDNDRLTFKLASPDDFWLHARGVPGAHVVIRNPGREPRPPGTTLHEAAEMAAWYSDAREADHADVQWTRRKNVRRLRTGPPGTVTLKRSETVRVRPKRPRDDDSRGPV